jgi:hypothetical protein
MSAEQTPGRGVSGPETPTEGHPDPAGRVGVCGNGAPHVLIKGSGSFVCDLPAGHAGWHQAGQIGSTPMHWGVRGDDWADTLFEQRDAALDAISRIRAVLAARRVECPDAEFIAIADIKAALDVLPQREVRRG